MEACSPPCYYSFVYSLITPELVSMPRETVHIALGSNLENPVANIQNAITALSDLEGFSLLKSSSLYRSPPMGPQDQPDYINAVVYGKTSKQAIELLDELQGIEKQFGRKVGGRRWGERELDLDILLFGNKVINHDRLQVPHVGLSERAFVLVPLIDLNPKLEVPGLGSVDRLLSNLPVEQVNLLERL